MNKLVLFFILLAFSATSAHAHTCCSGKEYDFERDYRCTQLIEKIRAERNTIVNVLGLSEAQKQIKTEIDSRRTEELQPLEAQLKKEYQKLRLLAQECYDSPEFKAQRKVVKSLRKKIRKTFKKYDREFLKILCSSQKSKYREVVKLTRREVRYCKLNKKSSPKNPYINTFGKCDSKDICEICGKHSQPHIFHYKHKYIEELEK